VVERDGEAGVVLDSGVVLGGEAAVVERGAGGTTVTVSEPGVVVLR
jgi:maltooligosyltrehalose trehalohydrolase